MTSYRQFSLEELFGIYKGLNPKAEKEWEAWLHGKLHIIIHKAPYPSISTVRAVNKWLQKQLEGWLGVVKEMVSGSLGEICEPLLIEISRPTRLASNSSTSEVRSYVRMLLRWFADICPSPPSQRPV